MTDYSENALHEILLPEERIENMRLHAELAQLAMEFGRLTRACETLGAKHTSYLDEIERLRKALQSIEDLSGGGYEFTESGAFSSWQLAAEALGHQ